MLVYAIAALFAAIFYWSCGPWYELRTLDSWLHLASRASRGYFDEELFVSFEEASNAVFQIGERAVPGLLRNLRAEDSRVGLKLKEWAARQDWLDLEFASAEDEHRAALTGFWILGERGRPAIPDLSSMLLHTNTTKRAATALAYIGPEALPVLRRALTNSEAKVRRAALDATSMSDSLTLMTLPEMEFLRHDPDIMVASAALLRIGWGAPPEKSVPVLREALHDVRLRSSALRAARASKETGSFLLPEILMLRTNADERIAREALMCLMAVASPDETERAVLEALESGRPWLRRMALSWIDRGKVTTDKATAALMKLLGDDDLHFREAVKHVLKRIDPISAAAAGIDTNTPPPANLPGRRRGG